MIQVTQQYFYDISAQKCITWIESEGKLRNIVLKLDHVPYKSQKIMTTNTKELFQIFKIELITELCKPEMAPSTLERATKPRLKRGFSLGLRS